tara:strand:- start:77 stop:271 length:195 start_codon:yes stop_codon:yes gene_type:complete
MQYLIIKEQMYENISNSFFVVNQTDNIDKAEDMLQGYNLISENKDSIYSIIKYEQPQILDKKVA